MSGGKSIKLFLVDGDANGLVTAEIGQWTGKALLVPRASLDKLAGRPEAAKPGIYVLAGPDPDRSDRDRAYVGEAENVFQRLRQHVAGKEFWKTVCLFTSSDEQLTKGHIKYLESRLVEIVSAAGRVVLDNGNVPPKPALPESDRADMETYLSQVQVLLPVLGLPITQPIASRRTDRVGEWQFELSAVGVTARAREDDGEFVVLKGSHARKDGVDSWKTGLVRRDQLVEDGVLVPAGDAMLQFSEDVAFSSPSLAAAVIMGRNTNGRLAWKLRDTGQTYADWQEAKLNDAAASSGFGEPEEAAFSQAAETIE